MLKLNYHSTTFSPSLYRFSPDSKLYALGSETRVYVKQSCFDWSRCIATIDTGNDHLITEISFSPNSRYIAILIQKKNLILIYGVEGGSIAKIEDNQAGIVGMIWAPDSVSLLTFSDYGFKASIYNLSTKEIIYIREPKISTPKGLCFSKDGNLMGMLHRQETKDYLEIYFTINWKLLNVIPLETFDAIQVHWLPNEASLLVLDNIVSSKTMGVCPFMGVIGRLQPYDYALGVKSYGISMNILALGHFDEKIRLVNCLTWKQIAELDCSIQMVNTSKVKVYREANGKKIQSRQVEEGIFKLPQLRQSNPTSQGIGIVIMNQEETFLACRNGISQLNRFHALHDMALVSSNPDLARYSKLRATRKNVKMASGYSLLSGGILTADDMETLRFG